MALLNDLLHDGRQSQTALAVRRGVCRHLAAQGLHALCEVSLPNGRRADIVALCPKGLVSIVEIKSSLADWRADGKWPEYLPFCDRLSFACPPDMNHQVFPQEAGLMLADGYGAEVVREAPERRMPPARRRQMTLVLARLGAARLMTLGDPEGFGHLKGMI